MNDDNNFREDIRNYLNQLQDVIKRMADNSKSCKQYCITIFSGYLALLGVIFEKNDLNISLYVNIGMLLIIIAFMCLDALYLKFERLFRNIFNSYVKIFRENANSNILKERIYDFNIKSEYAIGKNTNFSEILFSISVLPLYIPQITLIILQLLIQYDIFNMLDYILNIFN
ncbi:hypothetical protein [uncultured Brachyspira sp.]|uniref:hypothetical protein n=1 Tax=uncultured Brachyspira sp. TaxID=221953 RepID=UPI00260AEF19|nr:hypothetical protein [uncultured Brachyspira sp.]